MDDPASAHPFFGHFTPSGPIISTLNRPRNAQDILLAFASQNQARHIEGIHSVLSAAGLSEVELGIGGIQFIVERVLLANEVETVDCDSEGVPLV